MYPNLEMLGQGLTLITAMLRIAKVIMECENFEETLQEEYDVIVLGTGLKECVLSGLLGCNGKKVLHLEQNDYYGGDCASITPLNKLFDVLKEENKVDLSHFGSLKEYNVDLIPKFLMGSGNLVKMLIQTGVTRYLKFKNVGGSFVYKAGKLHKVPVTVDEAIKSSLLGLFEKRRFSVFLTWVQKWSDSNEKTWDGLNPNESTMADVYKKFGLSKSTEDFIGHAIALYTEDSYVNKKNYGDCITKIKLYHDSLSTYSASPYLYPMYGLGDLPQGFSRLSAVYGGTFILRCPFTEVLFENDGKFKGVEIKLNNKTIIAKAKQVIGEPSYFKTNVKYIGQVVRCICILSHPIDNTHGAESCQIILPQSQINRQHDIYIMMISSSHCVCPKNRYIVIVSTTVETSKPKSELDIGLKLLGQIDQKFYIIKDMYEPTQDGISTNVFITSSYDATSHFESTCDDILKIWENMTGNPLDLSKKINLNQEELED